MDQSLTDLVNLFNSAGASHSGTVVAALVLSLLVYLLQKVPAVYNLLNKTTWSKKATMLVLATVPAVVLSLTTKASWYDACVTAVVTFLSAVGVDSMLPVKK